MENQELLEHYKKSKLVENVADKIRILEDFKVLTDSSDMPLEVKDRFFKVADRDIKGLLDSELR